MSVPKEMYREQYGEYAYWSSGVKGWRQKANKQQQNNKDSVYTAIKGVLNATLMIIPWFPVEPSRIFFHFTQRSDESEENEDSKVNRKEEYKNGREKEGRENGNVNHHTTEQPSKERKEDFSESKSWGLKVFPW